MSVSLVKPVSDAVSILTDLEELKSVTPGTFVNNMPEVALTLRYPNTHPLGKINAHVELNQYGLGKWAHTNPLIVNYR